MIPSNNELPSVKIRKIVNEEYQAKKPATDPETYTAYCLEAILKYLDEQYNLSKKVIPSKAVEWDGKTVLKNYDKMVNKQLPAPEVEEEVEALANIFRKELEESGIVKCYDWAELAVKKGYRKSPNREAARVPLNEEKLAKEFYEGYVKDCKATTTLSSVRFEIWENLPQEDKMRMAFVLRAREICAKFSMPDTQDQNLNESNAYFRGIEDGIAKAKKEFSMPDVPSVEDLIEKLRPLRGHYYCEDSWYSCPLSTEGCADDSQINCNCGYEERLREDAKAIHTLLDKKGKD